jgi:tRNA(Ile)-lysidine synthase
LSAPLSLTEFDALMAPLGPFGPAPRLVAGVSGGPHSLALALLAEGWARRRGGSLQAVICDHGLRAGSAAEAAAAAAMLTGRGIAARVVALGLPAGPRLQERAREARMAALLDACAEAGAPWLLLGHHRADQAETLLMRAASGSGVAGLAGMAPARGAGAAMILRPLLGVPPAQLEAVLAEAGLAPLRDPSNADPRFFRARLRGVLGDPDGEGAAVAALARAAAGLGAWRAGLAEAVADRLAAAAWLHEAGFARLDLGRLGRDAVARAALGALLRVIGGRRFAPPEAAIGRLLETGAGTLGGTVLRRDGLLLREASALAAAVPAVAGAVWDGRFRLAAAAAAGFALGAAGEGARALPRPAWLPGAVVPTLPALHREGMLAVMPGLAYPDRQTAALWPLRFAPVAGSVVEDAAGRMEAGREHTI